MIGLIFKTWRN